MSQITIAVTIILMIVLFYVGSALILITIIWLLQRLKEFLNLIAKSTKSLINYLIKEISLTGLIISITWMIFWLLVIYYKTTKQS